MSNKTEAIKQVTLLKKRAKQIISDKKKLEEIKPEILPHFINKLTQLIENIEKIENLDDELAEFQKEFQNLDDELAKFRWRIGGI